LPLPTRHAGYDSAEHAHRTHHVVIGPQVQCDRKTTRATGSRAGPDLRSQHFKDIIETRDFPTGNGSPLFDAYRGGRDGASVAALREAGAVIIGKTVTTEFASSEPRGTRNPFDALSATGAAPVGLNSTGNPVFAAPGSMLGVPALSLPVLHDEGLPLGPATARLRPSRRAAVCERRGSDGGFEERTRRVVRVEPHRRELHQ
jgi:hypothetical protein